MASRQNQVKIVLLGDSAVGKSSIVLRFVKGEFQENHEPTIGAAFLTQKCRIPEDPTQVIKFEIWDTAGQERFSSLAPMYYRNAQAAIIVYDVTQANTFNRARLWINELRRHADPNVIIALVGNKSDLIQDARKEDLIPQADASDFARSNSLLFYITSAKTGSNIVEMFTDIARHLPSVKSNASALEKNVVLDTRTDRGEHQDPCANCGQ